MSLSKNVLDIQDLSQNLESLRLMLKVTKTGKIHSKFKTFSPQCFHVPCIFFSKDHVDYENYRHVVHKWYFKIAKALVVCLESKDYVQIRNALIILTRILPHFPVIVKLHGVIEKRIEKVCEEEKESRKDLYVKAMSYSGQLKVSCDFELY